MKLSDMIRTLEDVRAVHGDLLVSFNFEPIKALTIVIEQVVSKPPELRDNAATLILVPIRDTEA